MKHLVDLIAVIISYPLLIGLFIWVFYPQLRDALAAIPSLAGRVSKIGLVELQQQGAVAAAITEGHGEVGAPALAAPREVLPPAPDLAPFEVRIREHLQHAPNREDDLVRTVAALIRNNVAQQMFGTQLAALRALVASGPLPEAALKVFFQEHVRRAIAASQTPLPFLQWVGFLVDRGLAVVDDQGRFVVTDTGRALLQFANNAGMTEAKQF
jgi:hypothetical protein